MHECKGVGLPSQPADRSFWCTFALFSLCPSPGEHQGSAGGCAVCRWLRQQPGTQVIRMYTELPRPRFRRDEQGQEPGAGVVSGRDPHARLGPYPVEAQLSQGGWTLLLAPFPPGGTVPFGVWF